MTLIRAKSLDVPAIASALALLWLFCPVGVLAQDQIFGAVTRSDLSVPGNGEMQVFAYIDGTDQEVKILFSTGLDYDIGFWLDDFRNYGGSQGGQAYDHFFYNPNSGEGYHLAGTIATFGLVQEDITLGAVTWPTAPDGVTASAGNGAEVSLQWTDVPGLTYHIYRRLLSEPGSFFRLDDPTGNLANRGVSGGSFTDNTSIEDSAYQYLLVAENDAGDYSPHSEVVVINTGCCIGIRGNVNAGTDDVIDIADVVYLVAYMFKGGDPPPCLEEANINGGADGVIDIADLVQLVAFAFKGGAAPPACP